MIKVALWCILSIAFINCSHHVETNLDEASPYWDSDGQWISVEEFVRMVEEDGNESAWAWLSVAYVDSLDASIHCLHVLKDKWKRPINSLLAETIKWKMTRDGISKDEVNAQYLHYLFEGALGSSCDDRRRCFFALKIFYSEMGEPELSEYFHTLYIRESQGN